MAKNYTNYKIDHSIDDKVMNRFGEKGVVCGYYICRHGLMYDIENADGRDFEYPQYVKSISVIGITP